MTPNEMKSVVQKNLAATWERRDLDEAFSLTDNGYSYFSPPYPAGENRDAARRYMEAVLAAFTETRTILHEIIAEGDTVIVHWTWQAVHSGEFLGIRAGGKPVQFSRCSVFRFKDGRIAEEWDYGGLFGILQQLGVLASHS